MRPPRSPQEAFRKPTGSPQETPRKLPVSPRKPAKKPGKEIGSWKKLLS